ncbi:hypothetical protein P4C99_22165 [Pontiellaceae bacterium B1224]|nr:hypothetical protein [Pontiellaceae bacterium B1224]
MKVQLTHKPEDGSQYLTIGKEYVVLGIEADSFRILDDSNEPYLYDPNSFIITNSKEPTFWVSAIGDEGERYSYPKEWNQPGFFEDYFDEIEGIRNQFWKLHNKLYEK